MKKINIILVCLLAVAFSSCSRLLMEKDEPSNPVNVFQYLWSKVDQQYSFFDIKGVDWDSVYAVYSPLVNDEMSDDSLFLVCAAMLNTLHDGHTDLTSDFDYGFSDTMFYWNLDNSNFNGDIVKRNYLTVNAHVTGSLAHNAIRDGKVAYVRYSSFSSNISEGDLQYILNRYSNCDGIILDLRQNGGGSDQNITKLLSILDCHGQPLYMVQHKAGPGHNDFTSPVTIHAPAKSILETPYTKPIAVLIDRGSFSATSYFAICTQAFDNVKLFGDYTGGGTGMPNGGLLPNGWNYRFSCSRSIALDGGNYENGVPPEVRVLLDPVAVAQGLDNIIETAADWIVYGDAAIASR